MEETKPNPGNLSKDKTKVELDPNYKYSSFEMKEILRARADEVNGTKITKTEKTEIPKKEIQKKK